MSIYNLIMGIHGIGILALFIEIVYVTIQKPSRIQSHLLLLLYSTLLMFIGYYFELKATNVDVAFMGTIISYTGKPFILNCGFLLVCDFYDIKIKKWLYYFLDIISAIVTFGVYTTRTTRLYYTNWSFNPTLKYSPLLLERGPLYFLYLGSIVVFFVLSIYVIVQQSRKKRSKENKTYALYFTLMLTSGFVGYMVYILDLTNGYDSSVFGLMGSILFLSILFFRYRIFDVLNFSKDLALEESPTGVIITDTAGDLSYANKLGNALLKKGVTLTYLQDIKEDISRLTVGDVIYEIVRKKASGAGSIENTSYEFTDVTSSVDYQKRLEHDVEKRAQQIENIQRDIIGSLASIVEARSLETGEHIIRTKEYVEMIAKELRKEGKYLDILTNHYIELLSDAAPLHDLGKISIPDAILNKPGKLTPEEFEKMKVHVLIGAEIIDKTMRGVENEEYVEIAREVALYHHEWWNGNGYTQKLKGNEIPLSARIMALADCYDALISERVYKPPFTKEETIKIMREKSGTHFDPELVEAFIIALN